MEIIENLINITLNDVEVERLQLWNKYNESKKKFFKTMKQKGLLDLWEKRNKAIVTHNNYKTKENFKKVELAQQNLRCAYRKVMDDTLKKDAYTFFEKRDKLVQFHKTFPNSRYTESILSIQNYFRLCSPI